MTIAVLGTGSVGRAIAARLHGLGHAVVVGTRDPAATLARTEPDAMGRAPFAAWHAEHADVALATYAEAAAGADARRQRDLGQRRPSRCSPSPAPRTWPASVLVDVSNPLDSSSGFPPTLLVKDTDSLGEQVQRASPRRGSSRPSTR